MKNSSRIYRQYRRRLALPVLFLLVALPSVAAEPGDIRFQREGAAETGEPFPPAVFEHWRHRVRYRCDACHDNLFAMEAGATEVSMALISEAKVCGACHDGSKAFDTSFKNCGRCHRAVEE